MTSNLPRRKTVAYSGLEIEENEMVIRRHKYRKGKPTATFGELSYLEQSKSIRMTEINLQRMKESHKRRSLEKTEK